MLETLDYTIRIGSIPTFLYFDLYLYSAYAAHFVYFTPQLRSLTIDGHPVETVRSHKVLGLTIQNNLKWDEHIHEIVSKASKRLHILWVLRRSGIPPADLLTVYIVLIRLILEYSCEVWHNSISCYLSDKLEKIQKRAMRIVTLNKLIKMRCCWLVSPNWRLDVKTLTKITRAGPLTQHVTQTRSNEHNYFIRSLNNLSTYKCQTDRFKNSFFPNTINIANSKQ